MVRWAWLLPVLALGVVSCGRTAPQFRDDELGHPAERLVIKFSHVSGEDTPKGQAAQFFARRVRALSSGQIEVQVFANSSYLDDANEMDGLADGKVHFLAPSVTKLASLVPQFQVLDLPFLFMDEQSFVRVMGGPAGKQLIGILHSYGLQGLDVWPNGLMHFFNRLRPIQVPGDLAGMVLRVQSPVRSDLYRQLGVEPRLIGFSTFVRQVSDKTVDGTESVPSSIYSSRLFQAFNHVTIASHGFEADLVVTSRRWWRSLPEHWRVILSQALAEATNWERENAPLLHWNALEQIRKSGTVAIHQLSPAERAEWVRAVEPIYTSLGRFGDRNLFNEVVRSARPPGN